MANLTDGCTLSMYRYPQNSGLKKKVLLWLGFPSFHQNNFYFAGLASEQEHNSLVHIPIKINEINLLKYILFFSIYLIHAHFKMKF